jgi:hypothetical protein
MRRFVFGAMNDTPLADVSLLNFPQLPLPDARSKSSQAGNSVSSLRWKEPQYL